MQKYFIILLLLVQPAYGMYDLHGIYDWWSKHTKPTVQMPMWFCLLSGLAAGLITTGIMYQEINVRNKEKITKLEQQRDEAIQEKEDAIEFFAVRGLYRRSNAEGMWELDSKQYFATTIGQVVKQLSLRKIDSSSDEQTLKEMGIITGNGKEPVDKIGDCDINIG